MDALGSFLTAEIIKALSEGNLTKFIAYLAIFLLLWFQLRGLKKEMATLNATISKSFADGEHRFDNLEKKDLDFEHRITLLEKQSQGG